MVWPLLLLTLGGTGAVVADQRLNEGHGARAVGDAFSGAAGDLAEGATNISLERIIGMVFTNETVAQAISDAFEEGDYNQALDIMLENLDEFNYSGVVGLIAGGYLANSVGSAFGANGLVRAGLMGTFGMFGATVMNRVWSGAFNGNPDVQNIITQAQGMATDAAAELRQQNRPAPPVREPEGMD